MKTIDDILKRAQPEKIKNLAQVINLKSPTEAKIKEAMKCFYPLHRIITSLGREEINIFRVLYSGNDEISFGELNKILGLEINVIEKAVQNLSRLMLAYVIKNRQMLNKKMDRIHCISEVAEIFRISEIEDITGYLNTAAAHLVTGHGTVPDNPLKDTKSIEIITSIVSNGGVLSSEKFMELYPARDHEKTVKGLITEGAVKIFTLITDSPHIYIGIGEPFLLQAASGIQADNLKEGVNVFNSFKAAVNIIKAYDVISSTGLFLTKQNKFRKIDLKKISEVMLGLSLADGTPVDEEESCYISMQMLNLLKCLRLDRDIGIINIKGISEKIEDPILIMKNILLKLHDGLTPGEEFRGNIPLPPFYGLKNLLEILQSLKSVQLSYLKLIFRIKYTSSGFKQLGTEGMNIIPAAVTLFKESLDFLTLCGLSETVNGKISLTDSGRKITALLHNKKYSRETEALKCIYISPDFTLMIPHRDVDPVSLYIILCFTEIIKEDVVVETAITKNSIISAKKRGMNIEKFIMTLKKYAKNDIPQNLEFLLDDWTRQTISVNISRPILLHSNHGSFIDEILYSSSSKSIMTRISENYAIIDKDSIDTVVKFSKKSDAVITIFEEND